jgi:pimeloyl-ACP methyl ester carboxylesterase
MAAGFSRLLDLLRIDRAFFVGSSLGACWLQIFTSDAIREDGLTCRVAHLLIGNTFVDAEPLQQSPLFARSLVNDRPAADVQNTFHDFVCGLPECELRTIQLSFMREQSADELAGRLRMVANCGAIPISIVPSDRMTVLTCDDDGVTTREVADGVRKSYPHARQVAFAAGGHYPHVNRPEQYNELLQEILLKRSGASAP